MAALGVLLCEVLELEFAQLLAADPGCARVTVVDTPTAARLIGALRERGLPHLRTIREPGQFRPTAGPGREALVQVLELGLHARRENLQQGLVAAALELGPQVDALFLGYGLCGNALEDPQGLLAEAGLPIFLPMDEDHPVDDCVGLVIGGRGAYYEEQCKVAGTFFMTPGWTYHWKQLFNQDFGNISVPMAKRLFAHYERTLLLQTPWMPDPEMRRNAAEFNEMFACRSEVRPGTLRLLQEAWESASAHLEGPPTDLASAT